MITIDIGPHIEKIKALASTVQERVCYCGAVQGDGMICDCKYITDRKAERGLTDKDTGCCEAREIMGVAQDLLAVLRMAGGYDHGPV